MKEISQTRLSLSQLHRLHGPVIDFYRQQVARISPINSLSEMGSIKYYLGLNFFPLSELEQLRDLWPTTNNSLAQDLSMEIKQLLTIQEELLLSGDILNFDELLMQFKSLYTRYQSDSSALLELLKNEYQKVSKLHLISAKTWTSSNQVVFHGIKFDYAGLILEEQKINGYTTQRYWADGKRRQDHEEDYEASLWMKGISTTRSLEFASNWAPWY